jgi:hypothetical protein
MSQTLYSDSTTELVFTFTDRDTTLSPTDLCDQCTEYFELIDNNLHDDAEELGCCGECVLD